MSIRWLGRTAASILLFVACGDALLQPEPRHLRSFHVNDDVPISGEVVSVVDAAWQVVPGEARSVKLFEVPNPGVEATRLIYRARMSSQHLEGKAYLEMWVRLPGRGMFFSRGLDQALSGNTGWIERQTIFFLKAGERPDLIQLNVVFEDPAGRVSLKDVQLLELPLTSEAD